MSIMTMAEIIWGSGTALEMFWAIGIIVSAVITASAVWAGSQL